MPETFTIKINGQTPESLDADLLELEVDTNVHLPAMLTMVLDDRMDNQTGKLEYTDGTTFALGAEIKLTIETDEIPSEASSVTNILFIGEITSLEPIFPASGHSRLRVRAYDRSHRLARGKKTRTFGDANPTGSGIDESTIVSTIANENGLTPNTDSSGFSSVKYFYVLQHNQTDLEFLWARARQIGYQVYVDDRKLCFQKSETERGTTAPAELDWGLNLGSFVPRLTTVQQLSSVKAHGWDAKQQSSIEAQSTAVAATSKLLPQIGLNNKGSALANTAFSLQAAEAITDTPVVSINHATALASARLLETESEIIRADGVCRMGDPRLIAGRQVTINGVGEKFSGKYFITQARHSYKGGHYLVSFSVTGRAPNTLDFLLHAEAPSHPNERIAGVVVAKVTNLQDPENLGRVQVKYPWLPKNNGAELSSAWARITNSMAGAQWGTHFLPEVDNEVLVAFDRGDMDFPYIIGALYSNVNKPPGDPATVLSSDKSKVDQRIIKSRSGHTITLNDKEGEEQILILDKTTKNQILIDSKNNDMTTLVEQHYNITAKGDCVIKTDGDTTIEAKGNLNLKSTNGDVVVDCTNFKVTAKSNADIKPTGNLTLKATGNASLEGMMVSVKGQSMVQIQASGMTQIKGNPIMLN
ncbi:MAG: VgrG-related protein [Anaerolineales bacterium]|nr:VgrG-related protein [Anaerolineales bacterium]